MIPSSNRAHRNDDFASPPPPGHNHYEQAFHSIFATPTAITSPRENSAAAGSPRRASPPALQLTPLHRRTSRQCRMGADGRAAEVATSRADYFRRGLTSAGRRYRRAAGQCRHARQAKRWAPTECRKSGTAAAARMPLAIAASAMMLLLRSDEPSPIFFSSSDIPSDGEFTQSQIPRRMPSSSRQRRAMSALAPHFRLFHGRRFRGRRTSHDMVSRVAFPRFGIAVISSMRISPYDDFSLLRGRGLISACRAASRSTPAIPFRDFTRDGATSFARASATSAQAGKRAPSLDRLFRHPAIICRKMYRSASAIIFTPRRHDAFTPPTRRRFAIT